MHKAAISASELKRNVSEILNAVHFEKKITVIERYGKPIVKIVPFDENNTSEKSVAPLLKEYFGVLPDFPDVRKNRKFRKRTIRL